MRVVFADVIVVGKLGKVVEQKVTATPIPGTKIKVDHQVLELTVGEGLRVRQEKGEVIRFGFMLPRAVPDGPGKPRCHRAYGPPHRTGMSVLPEQAP